MIISFSGVDCAGKSTQIELLRQYLISIGKTCTVFWYRPGYSQEMQFAKNMLRKAVSLCKKINHGTESLHPSESIPKIDQEKRANPTIPPSLWIGTALADTALQWAVKLRMLEHRFDVVICDRYIDDAYLDLVFKYPSHTWGKPALQALAPLFPKPDVSMLLMLPYDEVKKRADAKNEPFPDDDETRKKRYEAYKSMNPSHLAVIDAARDIMEIHREIIGMLPK